MTNQKYHRRLRALQRLVGNGLPEARKAEREALKARVFAYANGGERCMNGSGKTRHPSNAAA